MICQRGKRHKIVNALTICFSNQRSQMPSSSPQQDEVALLETRVSQKQP